jgi:hypothetical protein
LYNIIGVKRGACYYLHTFEGSLILRMLRTSAVNLSASNKGNKSNKQSSFGLDIQVGNGIALSLKSGYYNFTYIAYTSIYLDIVHRQQDYYQPNTLWPSLILL